MPSIIRRQSPTDESGGILAIAVPGTKMMPYSIDLVNIDPSLEVLEINELENRLDNRNERHTKNARDIKVSERDGIIDLTDEDQPSIYLHGLDPEGIDSNVLVPAIEEIIVEQVEVPISEVVVTKMNDKPDLASIELKRKRLKERLEDSKEKMEKLNGTRQTKGEKKKGLTKKSESGKNKLKVNNSLLQGESVSTNKESSKSKKKGLQSKRNNSQRSTPTTLSTSVKADESDYSRKPDPVEDKSLTTKDSVSAELLSKDPPADVNANEEGSADPVISAGTIPTPEPTQPDLIENENVVESNPERQEDDVNEANPSPDVEDVDDQFNSGCNWFLCSAKAIDTIDEEKSQEPTGSKEIEKLVSDELESNEKNNTNDEEQSSQKQFWETLMSWIDPAPTMLMERLKEAEANRLSEESVCESIVTETIPEQTRSTEENTNVDESFNNNIETPALFEAPDSTEEGDDDKEGIDADQDSGTVSDAGLNSMPPLEMPNESFSLKGLHQHPVSAFEPVKASCLTPAASLEISPNDNDDDQSRNVGDDDDSVASDTKFFGDDLKSVPSVKEDPTEGVSELQPDDLGSTTPQPDSPSIVEKMEKLKKKEAKKNESKNAYKAKADESLEARRQALVKELRSAIATFGRYDIRCAKITSDLGDVLDEGGDHVHAVRLHKDATTIYSCKLGDDHTTTMDAKMRLGAVLENANQYDEAISMYYLVTVMRRALHGENDPSVADGLVQMAQALRKKSDFLQAIKELKRALKVYRESLGDAHEKVASTVDQIASLYVTVGDFDKSAAILEEVVKLKAATMGMSSKAVAHTLSTLATTYECSEKFNSAMKALKKAYKIYTEIGGYSSEDSTATLNRIAQLYEATGDQNRASIAYLGVLRARKVLRGADSLSVGETYFRLGHSLRETGQFDKALKCLKEALPIFVGQGVEMNDMKMVADIMHEMAFINQDKGNHQDAVRIFKQELSVRRKIGQPEYPLVARTLNHLGVAEFELQNHSRALKYLVEALTIFQERGEQGIECAEVLFNTGLVFDAVQNNDRALEAYTEASRIFRQHGYKDDHPHLKKAAEKIERLKNLKAK